VQGPAGIVLEQKDVPGPRFEYPASRPALIPNTRYTVSVEAASGAPQEAWFEVADPTRADAIPRVLREVTGPLGAAPPPTPAAGRRAGPPPRAGSRHDARQIVLAALTRDPDEPSLHTLLGQLYQQSGLDVEAARAFGEARFLTRGAK